MVNKPDDAIITVIDLTEDGKESDIPFQPVKQLRMPKDVALF